MALRGALPQTGPCQAGRAAHPPHQRRRSPDRNLELHPTPRMSTETVRARLQHVEPLPVSPASRRAPGVRAPREPEPALFGLVPGPLAPPVSRTPMGPRWRKGVDDDMRDGGVRRTALLRRTVFLMLALLQ